MIDAFKRDVLYKDDEVSAAVIDLIEAGRIIFVPAAASWRETGRLYNADPEATSERQALPEGERPSVRLHSR
jgi:hypothetical protein